MAADLLDAVKACTVALGSNDEHWESRMKALQQLQDIARVHADDPELCSLDVFRLLDEPFKRQVKDLRSAIVRETCTTISLWAQTLQDGFRPLAWMLLPTLVEMSASGNKVITACIHETVKVMLSHSHVKNAVPIIADLLVSRSNHVREACYRYLKVILEHYDTTRLEKHVATVESLIKAGMDDASGVARACCRKCFPLLMAHWPERAEVLFERLDPRTQKQLEKEGMLEPVELADNASDRSSHFEDYDSVKSPPRSTRSRSVERTRGDAASTDSSTRPHTARATSAAAWNADAGNVPFIGQRIVVRGRKLKTGIVQYVGRTHFAKGTWVGVKLDAALGRNNGSVDGQAYFECGDNFGLFVRPAQVLPEGAPTPARPTTAPGSRTAWLSSTHSEVDEGEADTTPPSPKVSRSAPVSPTKPPQGFGEPAFVKAPAAAEDGFLEDTPIGTMDASAEFAEEVLAAHRIHMDDLLESLRQEMLANSRFEALAVSKRSPEAVVSYLQQVQEHMDARAELSKQFHKQVAQFRARLALPQPSS